MDNRLKVYFIGVSWFLLSLFSSSVNDIIAKYMGMRLHSYEITFFRFFFGAITLIPFILYYGKQTLKTAHPFIHLSRGILLFFAMTAWTYGLSIAPVTTGTAISFATPLFVLALAVFFLNENIIWQRWLVTIIGFIGILITLKLHTEDFDPKMLIFIAATLAFAIMDIINKKFIIQESMLSMLFYPALIAAALSLITLIKYWQTPTFYELSLLFVLGASGNLILLFILKAFALTDATALAPYRYLELIISATAAYFIFNELPEQSTFYGALILIPSTLFIIYSEKRAINKAGS